MSCPGGHQITNFTKSTDLPKVIFLLLFLKLLEISTELGFRLLKVFAHGLRGCSQVR